MIFKKAGLRANMLRQRMIRKFDRIYKEARKDKNRIPIDFETDRYVIFSDHHKGDASPADDFHKNAELYSAALSYYQKSGYSLIVLGDNEELWENRYEEILPHYKKLIRLEIMMALESSQKRKIRMWGNHDKEVSLLRFKNRFLAGQDSFLKNVDHKEGLCLGEDIFLVHGHQGRFFEDKAWRLSRWAVHFIWKTTQKLLQIGVDGPIENFKIRDDLELNYYRWAKKNRVLLICGHTHRAIFGSLTHFDHLHIERQRLENSLAHSKQEETADIESRIADIRAEIKTILADRAGKKPKSFELDGSRPVPCYFNDGCCGYTNGITCIEIDRDAIRLIKWQRKGNQRIIYAEKDIRMLLSYIKEVRPIDKTLEPSLV